MGKLPVFSFCSCANVASGVARNWQRHHQFTGTADTRTPQGGEGGCALQRAETVIAASAALSRLLRERVPTCRDVLLKPPLPLQPDSEPTADQRQPLG